VRTAVLGEIRPVLPKIDVRNQAGLGRKLMRARFRIPVREETFRGGAGSPDFAGDLGDLHRREDRLHGVVTSHTASRLGFSSSNFMHVDVAQGLGAGCLIFSSELPHGSQLICSDQFI
jgi:hypothetical protein